MRFIINWYDGNENRVCTADTDGPFGIEMKLEEVIRREDPDVSDVAVNSVHEIPDNARVYRDPTDEYVVTMLFLEDDPELAEEAIEVDHFDLRLIQERTES